MAPNILGSYLRDSQSLIGYAWWLNSLLTVIAFVTASLFSGHADELDDMNGQNYNDYNDNNNNNNDQDDNNMRRWNPGSLNSSCLDFAAFYTVRNEICSLTSFIFHNFHRLKLTNYFHTRCSSLWQL